MKTMEHMILLLIWSTIDISCANIDVLVTINGAANLKCPTHSSRASTNWFVPGSVPPISKDNTLYTDNNRISITGNPTKGEYNLRISNFQTSDVGIYKCTVSITNVGYQHKFFNLLIGKPPKNLRIENFENQSTVQKKEGKELTLKCTVESGQPKEILRFEKNGHIIKESYSSTVNLTVILSHTDHQSRYTCKAISPALNVSLSQTITVNVLYAPQVNLGKVGESLMIKEGNNLIVNCIAEGNPKPYNYTWTKMCETTRLISNLPTLIINAIQRKYAGLYSCVVTNEIGTGRAHTNVVVMYPPDPPVNVTFVLVENGARLEWMANFNVGFKQSFFIEYREQGDKMWQKVKTLPTILNNRRFWTIGNLHEDRTYSFRMFSRNKIGDSNKTEEFVVKLFEKNNEAILYSIAVSASFGSILIIVSIISLIKNSMWMNKQVKTKKKKVTKYFSQAYNLEEHVYDEMSENLMTGIFFIKTEKNNKDEDQPIKNENSDIRQELHVKQQEK